MRPPSPPFRPWTKLALDQDTVNKGGGEEEGETDGIGAAQKMGPAPRPSMSAANGPRTKENRTFVDEDRSRYPIERELFVAYGSSYRAREESKGCEERAPWKDSGW